MKLSVRKSYAVLYCPGCESPHTIVIRGEGAWGWNGDIDRPTLHPSLLSNGNRFNPQMPRCHSFVKDGQIQFLGDCDHKLTGQTVDLPDVPECYQLPPEDRTDPNQGRALSGEERDSRSVAGRTESK